MRAWLASLLACILIGICLAVACLGEGGDRPAAPVTYVPPPPPEGEEELFKKIATGINFDKYDNIPVKFTGENPLPPINSFMEAGLEQALMDNIQRAKYDRPTPVQKYALPACCARRDLMACAQTGSGKTVSDLFTAVACHVMILRRQSSAGIQ